MALFILLLGFNTWLLAAPKGYPMDSVNIIFQKEAIIKNDFCFPVVVTVNGMEFQVMPKSSFAIGVDKWTSWNWMPGKLNGQINSKVVQHPLKGRPAVSFGPEETETHKAHNSYAYDFGIPEGTTVMAMEDGKVARIIQDFKVAHQDLKRIDETNTIEIVHQDGTVARYSHLQPGSAKVKHCEDVKAGTMIGKSGNVGYSKGPHLHVDIFRPVDGANYRTIPLKFK